MITPTPAVLDILQNCVNEAVIQRLRKWFRGEGGETGGKERVARVKRAREMKTEIVYE